MRVFHVISSNGVYGAENAVLQLVGGLSRMGCRAHLGVLCRPENTDTFRRRFHELNVSVETDFFTCSGKMDYSSLRSLYAFIRGHEFDIVHTHNYKSDFYGFLLNSVLPSGLVATCHNWPGKTRKMRMYERVDKMLLKKFDALVAVSEKLRQELITGGIDEGRVRVINNGIDLGSVAPANEPRFVRTALGIRPEEKVITVVGRLSEEKGHEQLIQAFSEVCRLRKEIRLLIVGDGPLRDRLSARVRETGTEDKVVFAGLRRDIPDILAATDIFVLPSLEEGLPMALLEAMAASRPVIATRVGAVPAVVEQAMSGLLVEPGDAAGLRENMLFMLTRPDIAAAMGKNAQSRVEKKYSSANMAAEYLKLYEKVAA